MVRRKSGQKDCCLCLGAHEAIKQYVGKAKHHFLILPKEKIPNLKTLKKEHLELLKHVEKKGKEIAEKHAPDFKCRFGYHAVPSMSHLHMHVISQDLDSPCLKNKKHWNSFTTEYFIDSEEIIKELEESGRITKDTSKFEAILKRDLRCHVCEKSMSNMPTLKEHIKQHSAKKTSS